MTKYSPSALHFFKASSALLTSLTIVSLSVVYCKSCQSTFASHRCL